MDRLKSKMGWEIVREELPDFKGEIFKKRPKNIVELLENTTPKYLDKVGFISEDMRLTFQQLDGLVNRIGAGLADHGVKRGDYVAPLLGTRLEFPLSFFGLQYALGGDDFLCIEKAYCCFKKDSDDNMET